MSVLPYYDVMINTAASCSNINNNNNDNDGGDDDGRIMTWSSDVYKKDLPPSSHTPVWFVDE